MRTVVTFFLAVAVLLNANVAAASNSDTWACCDSVAGCSYVTSVSATINEPPCGPPSANGVMLAFQLQTATGSLSISTVSTSATPDGVCLIQKSSACSPGGSGVCHVTGPCWQLTATGGAAMANGGDVYVEVDNALNPSLTDGIQPCTTQNIHNWIELSDSRGTYYCDQGNSLYPAGCTTSCPNYEWGYLETGDPPPNLLESTACDSCSSIGATCGDYSNDCGGFLSCGSCSGAMECNTATRACCAPARTCASTGMVCGYFADSCGITENCGSCPSGQNCSANQTQCTVPVVAPAMDGGMLAGFAVCLLLVGLGTSKARPRRT
jgi:hypothetical protein